ncbi:hypothetical protein [Arthrobacter sp. BPSS-3]|uniref:hypothetical protein n=1 Tax=Arthrobacter sp. BPSS-3 TaxID=3366580 RepID=UPI0037DCD350
MNARIPDPEFPADVPEADWTSLRAGQDVTVIEGGHGKVTGIIDAISADSRVLWVRPTGPLPRRLFLNSDPVIIQTPG